MASDIGMETWQRIRRRGQIPSRDRLNVPLSSGWQFFRIKWRRLAASVTAVSGALNPCEHQLLGHTLTVTGQTQQTHQVNEAGGQVDLPAVLAGGVVVWKRVVVIMVALTYCTEGDESVLSGVDVAVVRSVPPHVCSAVHQPRGI